MLVPLAYSDTLCCCARDPINKWHLYIYSMYCCSSHGFVYFIVLRRRRKIRCTRFAPSCVSARMIVVCFADCRCVLVQVAINAMRYVLLHCTNYYYYIYHNALICLSLCSLSSNNYWLRLHCLRLIERANLPYTWKFVLNNRELRNHLISEKIVANSITHYCSLMCDVDVTSHHITRILTCCLFLRDHCFARFGSQIVRISQARWTNASSFLVLTMPDNWLLFLLNNWFYSSFSACA